MKPKYIITAIACGLLSCGGGGNGTQPLPPSGEGYEAPEPPVEVNGNNLFTIDFWSRPDGGALTEDASAYEDIATHIRDESATRIFILDRLGMTLGQPSPLVDIAVKTRCVPFFAPADADSYTSQGTGFITRDVIDNFPGYVSPDGLIVSGCTVSFPLSRSRDISVMTCAISDSGQFAAATGSGGGEAAPVIIAGTIASGLEEGLREYLKYNRTDFRISVTAAQEDDKAYKLFILTPVYITVRSVLQTSTGGIPLYRCRLEYLD